MVDINEVIYERFEKVVEAWARVGRLTDALGTHFQFHADVDWDDRGSEVEYELTVTELNQALAEARKLTDERPQLSVLTNSRGESERVFAMPTPQPGAPNYPHIVFGGQTDCGMYWDDKGVHFVVGGERVSPDEFMAFVARYNLMNPPHVEYMVEQAVKFWGCPERYKFHELKTWSAPFNAILEGRKLYELRKNDRDFKAGDRLFLREWLPLQERYTGRWIIAEVRYMTPGGEWGLPEDLCVMSIKILQKG